MSLFVGLFVGIDRACAHWSDATMLQHTFESLKREMEAESDAVVDCAKGIIECVCQLIVDEFDSVSDPIRPNSQSPTMGEWLAAAIKGLRLGDVRDNDFQAVVSQHNKLAAKINSARNSSGPVSHGKQAYLNILATHQRRSIVLAADCLVSFLFEAYLEEYDQLNIENTKERYARFDKWNKAIDECCSVKSADVASDGSVEFLFDLTGKDDEELFYSASPSELLFHLDRKMYIIAKNASLEAKATRVESDISDEIEGE